MMLHNRCCSKNGSKSQENTHKNHSAESNRLKNSLATSTFILERGAGNLTFKHLFSTLHLHYHHYHYSN
jgi:hypothetical protein